MIFFINIYNCNIGPSVCFHWIWTCAVKLDHCKYSTLLFGTWYFLTVKCQIKSKSNKPDAWILQWVQCRVGCQFYVFSLFSIYSWWKLVLILWQKCYCFNYHLRQTKEQKPLHRLGWGFTRFPTCHRAAIKFELSGDPAWPSSHLDSTKNNFIHCKIGKLLFFLYL